MVSNAVKFFAQVIGVLGVSLGVAVDWRGGSENLVSLMDDIAPIIGALIPSLSLGIAGGCLVLLIGGMVNVIMSFRRSQHRKAEATKRRETKEFKGMAERLSNALDLVLETRDGDRDESKLIHLTSVLWALTKVLDRLGIETPDIDFDIKEDVDSNLWEWHICLSDLRALADFGEIDGARLLRIPR